MRLCALPLSLVLLTPVAAQEAPASEPAATGETWVVQQGTSRIGTETAKSAVKDGVRTLTTTGNLSGRVYTTVVAVGAADLRLQRSSLEVQGVKVFGAAAKKGFSIKAVMFGKTRTKLIQGKRPLVVLENAVFSHYDLLTRYAVREKGAFDFTLVLPSQMLGIKARFEPGEAYRTTFRGEPLQTRWGKVTVMGLEVGLAYDPKSGACYGVQIPAHRIAGFRKGFVLPPLTKLKPPELAAGARQVAISIPNPLPGSLKALPGTLTLPKGSGPFPVVVMIQGSGSSDRDETIGPNKPFRDLAYGLAAKGVATIRYDKRNWRENHDRVIPPERWKVTLYEESISDAVAALELAKTRKELGPRFVLGHSLGGLAAPYVAKEAPDVAGIVLMASPGRRFDVLLREQTAYQMGLAGMEKAEIDARLAKMMKPLPKLESGELKGKTKVWLGGSAHYWADMLKRDAPATLKTLPHPVLVLQGAKDCQVRVKDYEAITAALKTRPATASHEAKLFPQLNHLFMPVEGKSTGREYMKEARVAPAVIDALAAWIRRVGKRK